MKQKCFVIQHSVNYRWEFSEKYLKNQCDKWFPVTMA